MFHNEFTTVTATLSNGSRVRVPAVTSTGITPVLTAPALGTAPEAGGNRFATASSSLIREALEALPEEERRTLAIRRRQQEALAAAVAGGRLALLEYARREQRNRDKSADREWKNYRLYRPQGERYAAGVQTPGVNRYHCQISPEGVYRFVACAKEGAIDCPDQAHCDAVNGELRRAGLAFRLESKHARIMWLREEAARAGLLQWEIGHASMTRASQDSHASLTGGGAK